MGPSRGNRPGRFAAGRNRVEGALRSRAEVREKTGTMRSLDSPWRLRFDIASTLALAWLVDPLGDRELRPEVHYFLSERYGLLANEHRRRGKAGRAERLEKKAERHFRLSGAHEPPPAAAMAMPVPSAPRVVDAVSIHRSGDPEDAA